MKKTFSLLSFVIIALLLTVSANAQVYILNEDFSSAIGTTPPNGWSNLTVIGTGTDLWRFDNPGNRPVTYPLNGKVAIFDSQTSSGGGGAEKVTLESPFLDCSFSNNTLLYFDHQFVEGRNGKGTIEIYNGNNWVNFTTFTTSTPGVKSEVFDVSALMGGITNAKFRFTWEGDSSNYWMVDNIRVLAPLSRDANLRMIDSPVMPFAAGVTPMKVALLNEGYQTLTSATIKWTVNGVAQTPYSWTGNLSQGIEQNNIQIGTFNFPAGIIQRVKIWVESPNGLADLNRLNDTANANLAAALCGTYTIGGTSPSFANFTDASFALNNAGVSCPVVFKVRNGSYNEQIKLYEILGSSATNTITFEGENGDSSLAELHYQTSNPSNDFTLSLIGTDYINFNKMGIRRTNGTGNMFIQNGSHHVSVQNCRLGNVTSPNTSCDSLITIIRSSVGMIDISSPNGLLAKGIVIKNNTISSSISSTGVNYGIGLNNTTDAVVESNTISSLISATANGGACSSPSNYGVLVSNSKNTSVSQNVITSTSNHYFNNCVHNSYGFGITASTNSIVSNNNFTCLSNTGNARSNAGVINGNSRGTIILNNVFSLNSNGSGGTGGSTIFGINLESGNNSVIEGNSITPAIGSSLKLQYGVYITADSALVKNNNVKSGIMGIDGYSRYSEISSNIVSNIQGIGIRLNTGLGSKVFANKINGIYDGTGIVVNAPYSLVYNNYIQTEGTAISKGISLSSNGTGSSIVFNSVNIIGTDVINGQALEVLGGTDYIIKNNIFSNSGGGYAAYIGALPSLRSWDYNCYYSSGNNFGYYNGQNYAQLNLWGQAINGDPNSKKLNPFYQTTTDLLPSQRQINGAGIASSGVLLDIDGELRNQQAPDVGAQEFMVDFGVTRLVSPTNECSHTANEPVVVFLRQFGDIPFTNIKIAYRVNNGTIYSDIIPGTITNDLTYTFNQPQDLSLTGTYVFKVWLVDNQDDNPNNDTLTVTRVNKPAPVVDFSFITQCANVSVPFTGSATISTGLIARYEWEFGDTATAIVQNPVHIYDTAGIYQVTMRAFSDQGCYTSITKLVALKATPNVKFTVANACDGNSVVINNQTVMTGGSSNINYVWNFGDGNSSNAVSPRHLYTTPGTYNIDVTAASTNGCFDTARRTVKVYAVPVLSFNLASQYLVSSGAISLSATPAGGVFSGPGIVANFFVPQSAGVGNWVITYTYTDPLTGCVVSLNKTVLVVENPSVLTNPLSQSVCAGSSVTLSVNARGTNISYQWYKNGNAISGQTTASISFNPVAITDAGNYQVRVANTVDTVFSSIAILSVNVATSSIVNASFCSGTNYTLPNGNIVNTAGTYVSVIPNIKGCDSTITTILTISNGEVINQTITSCDSYVWSVNGQSYTQSGTYTAASACNTVVLNLTITSSSSNTTTTSECDVYLWNADGQSYTQSGSYTAVVGCVTEILNLTITQSTTNTSSASACDSYTWSVNGQVYTQSGTYQVANGCHTEALNLTITPSTSNTTTASSCDTYTWSVNSQAYTQSGTYSSVSGCHTELLNLTITPSTSNTTTASACSSYLWSSNGQSYTSSGNYTYVNGCNTQYLNLAINTNSVAPTAATTSSATVTSGTSVTLNVSGGSLGTAASWKWYSGTCGGTLVGTGTSISVAPTATTTYYVRAEGTCNTTTCAAVTVTVQSTTTCGPTAVVSNVIGNAVCSGRSVLLTVQGTLGTGASWKWYKGGCGTGTSIGTGASITVTPTCNTTYYVRSEGGTCGSTTCKSITISVATVPSTPGTITGNASGLCSASGVRYSIAAVSGATSYSWTVPTGATIVTGQGTISITVNYGTSLGSNSSCGSTSVCVKAVNACGSSSSKCLSVSLALASTSCGTITGPSTACKGVNANYSCAAVSGASTYTWIVPSGWTIISGQGTTALVVKPGTSQGTIKVTPSNTCGAGTSSSKSVKATSCSSPVYTKGALEISTETIKDISIWPNPANNYFNLNDGGLKPEKIEIIDALGRIVYASKWKTIIDVSKLKSGLYVVRIYTNEAVKLKRVEVVK